MESNNHCSPCFTDLKPGEFSWGNVGFNLKQVSEVKINLLDSKEAFNRLNARNNARASFLNTFQGLILIVEYSKDKLTPADKTEFKLLFNQLINEL